MGVIKEKGNEGREKEKINKKKQKKGVVMLGGLVGWWERWRVVGGWMFERMR